MVFFSLAFYSRYVSVLIFIMPFLWIFFKHFKKQAFYKYGGLIVITALVSLPHILIKTASITTFEHSWLLNWSFENYFKNAFITGEGTRAFKLPNLFFVFFQNFHPRYFYIGFVLIFFIKRKDFNIIFLIGILSYLLFLAGIPFQNTRFILLSFPLVLMVLFPAFNRLSDKINFLYTNRQKINKKKELISDKNAKETNPLAGLKKKKSLVYLGIMALQLSLLVYSFGNVYTLNKEEKRNVSQINSLSDKAIIYTSGYEGPLRSYSNKRVFGLWTDSISHYHSGVLMINDSQMKDPHLPPVIKYNYKVLKSKPNLTLLKTLDQGWRLYEIQ